MYFLSLDEIAKQFSLDEVASRRMYGGKGYNLARLIHGGFDVPLGFILSTEVFESEIDRALRQNPDKSVTEVVEHIAFSDEFECALRRALDETPGRCWAVRSSSTDEDTSCHSLAGLQESVIGISTYEECLSAIRRVWSSFYARERLLYPSNASLSGEVPAMAVVVQGFVESETAGVVFTHHPFEGARSMLINVSHGQGAEVVEGRTGESLTIERRADVHYRASECLNEEQIQRLCRVSEAIERAFGCPQDIEFSFAHGQLYILQARDIVLRGDEKNTIYSNVNVGEALSGVCTPMTWSVGMSIAKRGFETIFSTFGLTAPESYTYVSTFYGRIYINVSEILSVASQIPFLDTSLVGKVAGIKKIDDFVARIEPISARHFLHHLPQSLLRLMGMQRHLKHLPERENIFCRQRDALRSLSLDDLTHEELRGAFETLDEVFYDCGCDMLSAAACFLASYVLCAAFLRKSLNVSGESPESYLFSGLLDVRSAEPGFELLNMANEIRKHEALQAVFLGTESFEDMSAFREKTERLPGGESFWQNFDRFLLRYGSRANQEAELANARWSEDQGFLFQVICAHLKSSQRLCADDLSRNVRDERQAHTAEVGGELSHFLRPMFQKLLKWAQRNARLREQWRAYVVDTLGLYRRFFLASSSRMVREGILDSVEDVFYLTYEEFKQWLRDPGGLRQARLLVQFRRARQRAYEMAGGLPDTFMTHPNRCHEREASARGRVLYGLPASPGCVRARVRVLDSIDEASSLEYGEILVTRSTDVGWTPLFLVASAILTERGGPLSHAFVVAREYGVPAVVSIPNLLESLKTGDFVTVSGQKGIVVIEDGKG